MEKAKNPSNVKLQLFISKLEQLYRYVPGIFIYAVLVWIVTLWLVPLRYFERTPNEIFIQPDKSMFTVTLILELISFLT